MVKYQLVVQTTSGIVTLQYNYEKIALALARENDQVPIKKKKKSHFPLISGKWHSWGLRLTMTSNMPGIRLINVFHPHFLGSLWN